MKLSEYIKQYRNEHGLSQRQFASQCGLSNGFLSMIEKESNPKTGEPITPSLASIKQLASGMGMTAHQLLSEVDDLCIDLSGDEQKQSIGQDELPKGLISIYDLIKHDTELMDLLEAYQRIEPEKRQVYLEILQQAGLRKE